MRSRLFQFILLTTLLFISGLGAAQTGPVLLDAEGERWAQQTLHRLTLEEKIGQMLMVWAKVEFMNVNGPEYAKLRDLQHRYHLGGWGITVPVDGPLLLRNQPFEAAALTNQLQRDSDLPLIFAADFERGLSMRLYGVTGFPHAMAFGAAGNRDYAFEFGRITAEEARAIGIHWNFFPDADVNSNPLNPIINTRAFSENPDQVSEMVKAYIAGAHGAGMLTTVKHFPGHGDTDVDTHLSLARVKGDTMRLNAVELAPFRAAIDAGVDSVMVGHITAPALDPDPSRVASLSPPIIGGLLRQRFGFKGIVVTDAMDMNALTRTFGSGTAADVSGRAAVAAVKAGEDLILIPSDLGGAYEGLLRAVRSGEIPESRIDESVLRLLRAKASVGLHKNRFVDLNALPRLIARPENLAVAQRIADDAVTLVRNNHRVLPIRGVPQLPRPGTAEAVPAYHSQVPPGNRVLLLVFTDDMRSDSGRMLVREVRLRVPDARVIYIDDTTADAFTPEVLRAASAAQIVVAAVYVIPSAGRVVAGGSNGSLALAHGPSALLDSLLHNAGAKTVLVALGSPYLAVSYPDVQTYLCTFSNVAASETSAVKAIFGEIPLRGRLPVTIPGIAPRTSGLELDGRARFGGGSIRRPRLARKEE